MKLLYLVFFILGILIGQYVLLAYFRMRMGHTGWGMLQDFYDAWMDGDVEINTEDSEDEGDA